MLTRDQSQQPLIAIVAGEPSGDTLGAGIIMALKQRYPQARFVGIGGAKMIAAGLECLFSMERLAVMGIMELLSRQLLDILHIRKSLIQTILQHQISLFIGVDAPDFNLPVEKKLKRQGVKTVHYNSPTLWAWRAGRIKTIRKACDMMLTLYPFERACYQGEKLAVHYVGHPMADEIPMEVDKAMARQQLGLAAGDVTLALLPGSRHGEIARMAPIFLATAQRFLQQQPSTKIVVPMINQAVAEQFKTILKDYPALPVQVVMGCTREVLMAADMALITSGTATLEAALLQCPMVMAFKAAPVSAWLGRRLIKIDKFSLPNILSGQSVVPEYVQDDATPENLCQALLQLQQEDNSKRLATFAAIHRDLQQNSYQQAAEYITHFIKH